MSRYAMAIDLGRCNGCNACVAACKVEHNGPKGVLLTVVLEKEVGTYPNANRVFYPVLCNHCDDAPCVPVCPSGASYQRDDGLVLIDHDKCIGCGACIQACPYGQRFRVEGDGQPFEGCAAGRSNPSVPAPPTGVAVKCDFCVHRIDAGKPPACVEACPTNARVFGLLDAGEKPLNELISRKRARTLLPEMGTSPNVYYF